MKAFAFACLLLFPLLGDAQCLDGFRQSPSGMCVRINTAILNGYAAETACQGFSNGGHLVSIHSAFDSQFLRAYAQETPGASYLYIGLMDSNKNGNFAWIDQTALNYVNWCSGYPSTATANNTCVFVNVVSNNCWQNVVCEGRFMSLCEQGALTTTTPTTTTTTVTTTITTPRITTTTSRMTERTTSSTTTLPATTPISGADCPNNSSTSSAGCPTNAWFRYMDSCYRLMDKYATWLQAEANCEANHSQLASIHSIGENQFILGTLLGNGHTVWIGLRRDANNATNWVDNTPMDYGNYYAAAHATGNCGVMYQCFTQIAPVKSGKWDFDQCTDSRWSVCKMPASARKLFP